MGRSNNPNAAKNLRVQPKGEPSPPGAGRKPSRLRNYMKVERIASSDVQLIMTYIADKTIEELQEIAKDKNTPILVVSFVVALLHDLKRGNVNTINTLMTRAWGDAKQVEITGDEKRPLNIIFKKTDTTLENVEVNEAKPSDS